jgi:Uma2 family endonuclease
MAPSAERDYPMHMSTKTRRWTRADLARLPDDGNRYEVLDGELLVTPQASVSHQRIATDLVVALAPYCARHFIGFVVGPGAVQFGKNELQADVQVIPGPRPAAKTKWGDLPLPLLVVEILSESTSRRELGVKLEAYLRLGVPTYWVVDGEERQVTVCSPAPADSLVVTDVLRWQPRDGVAALEIPLTDLLPRAARGSP